MFNQKTVLVLGAGASSNFGFPIGGDLKEDLLNGITNFLRLKNEREFYRLPNIGSFNVSYFKREPIESLASYLNSPMAKQKYPSLKEQNITGQSIVDFYNEFSIQSHETIDKFIWDNPEHGFIGKCLITLQVLLKMYKPERDFLVLRKFQKFNYLRRNWYQQLILQIRDGAIDGNALKDNNLNIVTFNYDHSLENALKHGLGNTTRHQGANYQDFLSILHVNSGGLEFPEKVTDVGDFVISTSENLFLANEDVDKKIQDIRNKVVSLLKEAERVFVIGFDFDPINVNAIGLDQIRNLNTYCLNFGNHMGLNRRMASFGIPEKNITRGESVDNPIHIDEAINQGFLQQ